MDLTLYLQHLQQQQSLPCTDFSRLIETGRMTLILKTFIIIIKVNGFGC